MEPRFTKVNFEKLSKTIVLKYIISIKTIETYIPKTMN